MICMFDVVIFKTGIGGHSGYASGFHENEDVLFSGVDRGRAGVSGSPFDL